MSVKTGVILKVLSVLCMTVMSACVKGLDGQVPSGEVVFFRSIFALLPLYLWLRHQGDVREMVHTKNLGGHVLRGISGSGGMFLNVMTLNYLPLADTVVLGYAAPLMAVILAVLLLKESVRWYRWVGVAVGLAGVLVMQIPHLGAFGAAGATAAAPLIGAALGLSGALCSALSAIQIRRMSFSEKPGAIVLYFSLMTTVLGLVTIFWGWVMPTPTQLFLMIGAGVVGGIGQTLFALSLRHADASLITPFEYTSLIWSILIGYFIFNQIPEIAMITGGLIVAASGIFTIWREMHHERNRPITPSVD